MIIRQIGVPYPMKNALVAIGDCGFFYYQLTLQPKVIYATSLTVFYSVSIRSLSELYGSQRQEGETDEELARRKKIDLIR